MYYNHINIISRNLKEKTNKSIKESKIVYASENSMHV